MCIRDSSERVPVAPNQFLAAVMTVSAVAFFIVDIASVGIADAVIPVSYTHLDVYKRQGQHRSHPG